MKNPNSQLDRIEAFHADVDATVLRLHESLHPLLVKMEILLHQLAENPPTPTIPDCPENAPNARAPKVTAPTRGPR